MRISKRESLDRLGRYRQYFIAGHNRWFVFIMSLSNFSLIFYNFLWIKLTFIPDVFKNEFAFIVLFFMFYFPTVAFFGYMDLTRGTFKAEVNVSRTVNPVIKEQFELLYEIRKQNEEIIKRLKENRK